MKGVFAAAISLLLVASALADDQIRNVQSELKRQGFFYGDISGQMTAETSSALRRFQIRNGLAVTGTLNQQTLDALRGVGGKPGLAQSPPSSPARPRPPANLRQDEPANGNDREFLRREEAHANAPRQDSPAPPAAAVSRDHSVVQPPAPLIVGDADFADLFFETPYARAPQDVQQRTLRRAQSILGELGFYRDLVDGWPGPATEEALVTFQRFRRLSVTGRLDLPTLDRLRLLPQDIQREPFSPVHRGFSPRPPTRTYRGIWVN